MKTLLVKGWRSIPHSYAVVNQWQLLSLLKRKDIQLVVRDVEYYDPSWRPAAGLFDPAAEQAINSIPTAAAERPDATFVIAYPFDFSPAPTGRTAVFATAEHCIVPPSFLRGKPDFGSLANKTEFKVVTPSQWSRKSFVNRGLRADQVVVVPHGVDPVTFKPAAETRETIRKRLGVGPAGFMFGNFGALTSNKGVDLLLRAFAAVAEKHPDVRLLLKGIDPLYQSKGRLQNYLTQIPLGIRKLVTDRLSYVGNALSMQRMAEMYQMCDAYVSPYRAEGFNMPVLEAAACAIPVICSAGGPTDEFTTEDFAMRVQSGTEPYRTEGLTGLMLKPSVDHLVECMNRVIDDTAWRTRAAAAGPDHVMRQYTWDNVTDRLLAELF